MNSIVNEKKIAISVQNVVKHFDGRKILHGVSFDIYKGETFVIMGVSGCGKSTILRHMIGAIRPDSGKVFLGEKDLSKLPNDAIEKVKQKFGMCFQSAALVDSLSVAENVSLPLVEHTKLDPKIIDLIVKLKLSLVGLQGYEHLMPSMLSGGMRKRVGLARAIAMDPEIIFYDEPTTGLDPVVSAVVDDLLKDLSKKLLLTSVIVTHSMTSAFRLADRMVMMNGGKVIEVGTPDEIKNSKSEVVQQFINGRVDGPIVIQD